MSSLAPLPQCLKDRVVYVTKGLFSADVPVIHSPTGDLLVELVYKVPRLNRFVSLDNFSDIGKEARHVLFRRRNYKLAVVLANVLSEKVEADFYMRDQGLLFREFQPSFAQKLHDKRFDFVLKQLLRAAGNYEVVCIANHVDFITVGNRACVGECLLQHALHAVQCQVRQHRGDDPSLRSSFLGVVECRAFHVAAFNHFRSMPLSTGAWDMSHSWSIRSKQARMSPSSTHCGERLAASVLKHCSIASAHERSRRNPYEWVSAMHSATGSSVSKYIACITLSVIVGMPRGLFLPFFLRM